MGNGQLIKKKLFLCEFIWTNSVKRWTCIIVKFIKLISLLFDFSIVIYSVINFNRYYGQ